MDRCTDGSWIVRCLRRLRSAASIFLLPRVEARSCSTCCAPVSRCERPEATCELPVRATTCPGCACVSAAAGWFARNPAEVVRQRPRGRLWEHLSSCSGVALPRGQAVAPSWPRSAGSRLEVVAGSAPSEARSGCREARASASHLRPPWHVPSTLCPLFLPPPCTRARR